MRVTVLSLGGTITMTPSTEGGVRPTLGAEELLAAVPELAETGVELTARTVRSLPSASLRFADLAELREHVLTELAAGADGVVVAQGTDTLEETAFFLELTVDMSAPVVVTGAMRHPGAPGADGPANLLGAVRLAGSSDARGYGVLVCFADEIHAATTVRKTHTSSLGAFTSPGFGPLGWLVEGTPRLRARPSGQRARVPVGPRLDEARVGLLTVGLGDDEVTVRAVAEHCDGLVVAGLGAGHVPEPLAPLLGSVAAERPVVLASRVGAGPMLTDTYGYPGSERDLLARGLIPAGFLDPYKARVLLRLLLSVPSGDVRDRARSAFAAFA